MVHASKRKCKLLTIDTKLEIVERLQKRVKTLSRMKEFNRRKATFFSVNKVDVQEWLTTDRNEPGYYSTMTKKETGEAVTRPKHRDNHGIDKPGVSSHSKVCALVYMCL